MKNSIFLTLTLLAFALVAQAVGVAKLYSSQIPVADYSANVRNQALTTALRQVLIRVSGNPQIEASPKVQEETANVNSLVASYSYLQSPLSLQVNFSSKAVNKVLRQAGQAIWGEKRPLVLLWLAVTNQQGNSEVISDTGDDYADSIQAEAKVRGLPLLLPTMDLEDVDSVTTNDITQFNEATVKSASGRYGIGFIVIGHIFAGNDGAWQGKADLLSNDGNISWELSGGTVNQVLLNLVDDIVTNLAGRYAVVDDNVLNQQQTILITGVSGLDEYADVLNYLRSLNGVSKVELVNVAPNTVRLKVTSSEDLTKLVDNKLVAEGQNQDKILVYHWGPISL